MKYVIIVNGKPESGKTTFQKRCIDYININDLAYGHIHSSIDYIKNIYKKLGWDWKKTDRARKDLSILKQMWIDNCNGPLKNTIEFVMGLSNDSDHVIFVDVREESEIIKYKEVFDALGPIDIKCTTVFINRGDNAGFEYGNKSDDNVGQNMSVYEHCIFNCDSLEHFNGLADIFITKLLEE